MQDLTMEKLMALCKNRGFIFAGSEIYGGLANTWDYGPLGVEFKNNVKAAFWKKFVKECKYNVGIDSGIIMNPKTWEASGHIGGFSDPLMDCKECKTRHRADKLIEEFNEHRNTPIVVDGWSKEKMKEYIEDEKISCPSCSSLNFTEIREFNLMFKTFIGVTEGSANIAYLRPETAQGIFVNFLNVQRTSRKKIPFGICQIGKSFRNEITPGNFTFRTREFEQMELEFFCHPDEDEKWYEYWKDFCYNFLLSLNMSKQNIRQRDHSDDELSHYSKATSDIEYKFPFGFGELLGVANRTDFDLKSHTSHSEADLLYFDSEKNEHYTPYCIEPSIGADRLSLAFLCDSYKEEEVAEGDFRTVLKLHPFLAPIKIAILPLSKKLSEKASLLYESISKIHNVDFDDTGSIGKRYRRQDEIGTPFCITYDFETETDGKVTIRDRDSMEQERVSILELELWFKNKFDF